MAETNQKISVINKCKSELLVRRDWQIELKIENLAIFFFR